MNKIFILLAFLVSANLYAGYSDTKQDLDDIQIRISGLLDKNNVNKNYPNPPVNNSNQPVNNYPLLYGQRCYTSLRWCYLPPNQVLANQQCWCPNPYTGFTDYGIAK